MPPYLPDTPEIRGDMLDYYFAVERFDREVGEILISTDSEALVSHTPLEEMKESAQRLYDAHRDEIEATFS